MGTRRLREIRGVRPAPDRKQNLQLAVLLLEQEKLLNTSVHISTDVIPRVCRVMLLDVGPRVGQVPAILGQKIFCSLYGSKSGLTLRHFRDGCWQMRRGCVSASPRVDPAGCSCGRKLPMQYVNIGVLFWVVYAAS